MAKHVFGPVPSRRLGFSLGVDIIPLKYCSYDCIYCQIGKTTHKEIDRKSFFDPDLVIREAIDKAKTTQPIDIITFSGSGEPTLNIDLGYMVRELKKNTETPVAVITNGSLLWMEEVRRDILEADVVLPSLDAVSEDIFRYINRPHSLLEVRNIINGMKSFRREYNHQIWLEIMLVRDINDEPEELDLMKRIVESLNADKIQLNTVTRPPRDESSGKVDDTDLIKICNSFGPSCEIICSFEKSVTETPSEGEWANIILETLKRRPLTLGDIVRTTNMSYFQAKAKLKAMENEGLIKSYFFDNNFFFMVP